MTTTTPRTWHAASTGNHQGLVIEDETGRNIAVTYDKDDAAIVAAAPAMLNALIALVNCHDFRGDDPRPYYELIREARAIVDELHSEG